MSTEKLKGFGPIYYINLDSRTDREQWMQEQLQEYGLSATRVSAIDGVTADPREHLEGNCPEKLSDAEIACTLSHLKAIASWVAASDSETAIICEDDLDLAPVSHWPFTWKQVLQHLPYDWDIIQLSTINGNKIVVSCHPRFVDDTAATCYLIHRRYAEKLLALHVCGDRFRLDNGILPRAVSEELLFNAGKAYTLPLVLYRNELPSSVHAEEHVQNLHESSYAKLMRFWEERADSVPVEAFFKYDPFNRHSLQVLRMDSSVASY